MKQIAENLWTLHYPLSVLGTQHGRTVTIIRLRSGRLVVHSMAPFRSEDLEAIHRLGPVGWLAEAMLLHDTYAKQGHKAFPETPFLGPPGFSEIVGFPVGPLQPPPAEWQDELEVIPLKGIPMLEEHVVYHLPSKTLIVADLVFNFSPHERGWSRFFHRYIAGFKTYPGMSRIFRMCIRDSTTFRQSLKEVFFRDFDRVIVGHGDTIETNGKALLRQALEDYY